MALLPVPSSVSIPSLGTFPCHRWLVLPAGPPATERRCPRCDVRRTFVSAGAFRVNAHRRRLDVWLLLRCVACERVVRLPIVERQPVSAIEPMDLDAFTRNDPLRCVEEALKHGLVAPWALAGDRPEPPYVAQIELVDATARLDRVIARALGASRAAVLERVERGAIVLVGASARALRRRASSGQRVVVLG